MEKQTRRRLTRDERHRAVEQIRVMLAEGKNNGDIARLLKRQLGIKSRTVVRLVGLARERNLSSLGVSADEQIASSWAYWSGKLLGAETEIQRESRRSAEAFATLAECDRILCDPDSTHEQIAAAKVRITTAHKTIENSRRTVFREKQIAIAARDRLDRIVGVHAPTKTARTTSDGQDVDSPRVPTQPAARSSIAEINRLWQEIQSSSTTTKDN